MAGGMLVSASVMLKMLNLLGGCKNKIYNISCHVENFVFAPAQQIQILQHDKRICKPTHFFFATQSYSENFYVVLLLDPLNFSIVQYICKVNSKTYANCFTRVYIKVSTALFIFQ